jgi:hypothetical protein
MVNQQGDYDGDRRQTQAQLIQRPCPTVQWWRKDSDLDHHSPQSIELSLAHNWQHQA